MSQSSGPYEPFRGDHNSGSSTQNKSADTHDAINQSIAEATNTLRSNMDKMKDRGAALDVMQERTENLSGHAQQFSTRANKLRKDMWWKDMKMRICIIVGILVLLIVIIVPSVVAGRKNS